MRRPKFRNELGQPGLRYGICDSNAKAPTVTGGEFQGGALRLLCRCEEATRMF
jgi:hypothetical protein